MEMHAIQSKQASMSSGCIVANPDITLIRLTNQGPRFIGGRGIFRFAVTHDPYWGRQRFAPPRIGLLADVATLIVPKASWIVGWWFASGS